MSRRDLDISLLRTFIAVVDLGGVARAAEYVKRSQPAASLQIKRLQNDLGALLFRKAGRGLELTESGVKLVPVARRLIALHDQAVATVAADQPSGRVRIGIVEDLAEDWLTALLAQFSLSNPFVSVEIWTDRRALMMQRFEAGGLDLLLTLGETYSAEAENLGRISICWIGSDATSLTPDDKVPLVLLDAPCMFRDLALAAFAAAGRDCRLAFTSHSVSTQWSAVRAGLGVSLRTPIGLKWPLKVLEAGGVLPVLRTQSLFLQLFHAPSSVNKPASSLKCLLLEMIEATGRGASAAAMEAVDGRASRTF